MKYERLKFLRYGKVYIFPTYSGFAFLGFIMFCIVCATSTGNNLIYLLTIMTGMSALLTMIRAHQNLEGIEVRGFSSSPSPQSSELKSVYQLKNSLSEPRNNIQIRPKNLALTQDDRYCPKGSSFNSEFVNVEMSYKGKNERGIYSANRVKLTSTFPFGLWRVWMWVPQEVRFVVYPKPSPKSVTFASIGVQEKGDASSFQGGDDFYELKNYRDGDNPNHIDWKSYSRRGVLYLKVFSAGGTPIVSLNLDDLKNYDLEKALSKLSRGIIDLKHKGQPFELTLGSQKINFLESCGTSELNRCYELMARYGGHDFAA